MGVTTAFVESITGYVEGVDYSTEDFELYATKAQGKFIEDRKSLPRTVTADEEDEAVALLIGHYIARRKRKGSDKTSESIGGDYSYNRAPEFVQQTYWLGEYRRYLSELTGQRKVPSRGVERADIRTSRSFDLSNNLSPRMRYPYDDAKPAE